MVLGHCVGSFAVGGTTSCFGGGLIHASLRGMDTWDMPCGKRSGLRALAAAKPRCRFARYAVG